MASVEIALVCGLKVRVGCQDRLCVNSDADETLAQRWKPAGSTGTGRVDRPVGWWWYYPTPFEGWGRGGTLRRPNSRATPQGLDHRSRIEREEPKIDLRRGSEAGQSRRR